MRAYLPSEYTKIYEPTIIKSIGSGRGQEEMFHYIPDLYIFVRLIAMIMPVLASVPTFLSSMLCGDPV